MQLEELSNKELEEVNGGESLGYYIGFGIGFIGGVIIKPVTYIIDNY